MVADTQDGNLDVLRPDGLFNIRVHQWSKAVLAIVLDVGLQGWEASLPNDRGEDILAKVELMIAQGPGIVPHGIHDRHHGMSGECTGQGCSISSITQRGRLEVVHHRVALDVIAGAKQNGAVRIVSTLLLDESCQLGIAHERTFIQVAVRVVMMQDRHRDNGTARVVAKAIDAPI